MRGWMLVAALLLAGLPGRAGAVFYDSFGVQNWSGGARYNDDTNRFTHCSLEADYVSGITVYLWWSYDGFAVVFESPNWKMATGGTYPVRLTIDRFWGRTTTAEAITTNGAAVGFGYDQAAINAFRRGNLLSATTDYENFQFSLRGTNAAIDALQACFSRHSRRI